MPAYNGAVRKTKFEKSPEFAKFQDFARRLVAVPKAELQREIEKHDKQSKASGSRPGPKPKPAIKKRATR
jgi:hypothetical protein